MFSLGFPPQKKYVRKMIASQKDRPMFSCLQTVFVFFLPMVDLNPMVCFLRGGCFTFTRDREACPSYSEGGAESGKQRTGYIPSRRVVPFFSLFKGKGSFFKSTNQKRMPVPFVPWKSTGHLSRIRTVLWGQQQVVR